MEAHELPGLAVVSVTEADRIGRVSDVLMEPEPFRIAALQVEGERGPALIPFEAVQSIGPDAVMVTSGDALRSGAASGAAAALRFGLAELGAIKVVDERGAFHGTIERLNVDDSTGAVSTLELRKGGVLGMGGERRELKADQVVRVGRELLTIRATE